MPVPSLKRRAECLEESENGAETNNGANMNGEGSSGSDRPTYMARLFQRFGECLKKLEIDTKSHACIQKMEQMAIFVHESMSISSRNYHSVQHVFDISKDMTEPIPILAALFHDCIYYHVDGEFSARQSEKLKGAVISKESSANCILPKAADDELLQIVMSIFGFEEGQELTPFSGLNEYLSAVVAVRELGDLLSRRHLAEIACCIEATIPFRPTTEEIGTPMDRLFLKMMRTNETFKLEMTTDDVVVAVQQAAILANNDVGNFGTEDRGWFLDNTWSLLPESNAPLRHHYLFTVEEFQLAVFKMHGFFGFLKPTAIFQSFRGVPCEKEIQNKIVNATRNIEVGHRYIAAKLLSISVLAAIAELTGGDAPVSMFMGDLPSRSCVSIRLASLIPTLDETAVEKEGKCDMEVYDLLLNGRKSESSFDIRQSPLAAYFHGYMGDASIDEVLAKFKVYPMTIDTAKSLLRNLPAEPTRIIAEKICMVAPSRAPFLHEIIENIIG